MPLSTEEIQAAATAEDLLNQDGTEITTEEQLTAARELAANPPEETPEEKAAREAQEQQAEEDPLLQAMLQNRPGFEQPPAEPVAAAPEANAEREANLATLTEWGVTMPTEATDEELAAKVAEGKPAAPAPPAAPKPAKKKFSVVKKESASLIEPPAEPIAPVQPPAPVPTAPDADEDYVKSLTEEQKDELYEAEVAEMLEPVKYKGQKKKLIDFYRRFEKEATDIMAAQPEARLEETPQFQALVKAKPSLDPVVVKKVNRKIGSDQAEKSVESKLSPKMRELEMNQKRLDLTPKFDTFVTDSFRPGITGLITEDAKSPLNEVVKLIAEKGMDEAKKEFKLETKIYTEELDNFSRRVTKFLLLKNEATPYDNANPDPDHTFVLKFIESEGRSMANYESKNGKLYDKSRRFLPRTEFINMIRSTPAEAQTLDRQVWKTASYCTFTDTDILNFLARNAKEVMENRISLGLKNAEEYGFKRDARVKNPSATNGAHKAPTELAPPRTVLSPARGPSKAPVPSTANDDPIDVTSNLPEAYNHLKKRK